MTNCPHETILSMLDVRNMVCRCDDTDVWCSVCAGSASAHLRGLEGDLHTHGATDARQLASQGLLGLMGHLGDVFNGQVELRKRGILIVVNIYVQR